MISCGSPRDTTSASIEPAKLVASVGWGPGSETNVLDVNLGELRRPWDAMGIEELKALDHVSGACDVQAGLTRQPLDRAEGEDVTLRIPAPVRRRPLRNAETHGLVHHQRAWMAGEDLGRHADRVEGL